MLAVQAVFLRQTHAFVVTVVLFEVGAKPLRFFCKSASNGVDNLAVFVGGNGESGGKVVESVGVGKVASVVNAQFKALFAPCAPLSFLFQAFCAVQKVAVVVLFDMQFKRKFRFLLKLAVVHNVHKFFHFAEAFFPFGVGKNVVVGKVQRNVEYVQQPCQTVGGAGGAAHVQKQFASLFRLAFCLLKK